MALRWKPNTCACVFEVAGTSFDDPVTVVAACPAHQRELPAVTLAEALADNRRWNAVIAELVPHAPLEAIAWAFDAERRLVVSAGLAPETKTVLQARFDAAYGAGRVTVA